MEHPSLERLLTKAYESVNIDGALATQCVNHPSVRRCSVILR